MKKFSGVAGYTLLELMIVIFIISLIYYALSTGLKKTNTKTTKQLISELNKAVNYTRTYAVLSKQTQRLVINLNTHCYIFTDNQEQKCIDEHTITATGTNESSNSDQIDYQFFPDGSASGGHITIDESRIDINWITGKTTVHE